MSSTTELTRVDLLPRPLGDGLVLRSARHGDGAELADFNAAMHGDDGPSGALMADWTRDLFELPHPTFRPDRDVTVVEDTATGRIVSALFLIPQVWSYAGVPMAVGQPELIATHPDHRRRGLVRTQFQVVHEWSRAAGQLWQFIGGIAWYYRQFGYTYAIDLPPQPVLAVGASIPEPSSEFALRMASPADLPFLAEVEAQATSGTTLGPLRGRDGFALELARRPGGLMAGEVLVIERTGDGEPIGYVAHQQRLSDGLVSLRAFELRPGQSWLGPTAAVVAHLSRWVRTQPDGRGIRFALPAGHSGIRSAATRLGAAPPASYGLYVRVPDVVAFTRAIAPVLEARLAASPAEAWTGVLRLDLYTGGLQLHFDDGRLTAVESRRGADVLAEHAHAKLRTDELLHLLLGNRRAEELERTTADFLINSDVAALLLDVLFPPMPTSTWEVC